MNLPIESNSTTLTHTHDMEKSRIPKLLSRSVLRELHILEPSRAIRAIAIEWLIMATAMTIYLWIPSIFTYVAAVVLIGARQHALTVLAHDAAHYRFLPNRFSNEFFGNLLMMWPMFMTVKGFRQWHADHHRYLGGARDGNRVMWKTHNKMGEPTRFWIYPKTKRALVAKISILSSFIVGCLIITKGMLSVVRLKEDIHLKVGRIFFYLLIATTLTLGGWWWEFTILWLVPFCTWHVATQYMRLIAEHSNVQGKDSAYKDTRTTVPTRLESLLILPRNIGYHIEHHWYPGVPFYNLPALHKHLMEVPDFRDNADISYSIFNSLLATTFSSDQLYVPEWKGHERN